MKADTNNPSIKDFLNGKSVYTLALFDHFVDQFSQIGSIQLHPAKTMIGIGAQDKRIAWITQLGKNFIHIVFPFPQPFADNLCFQKIAEVPGGPAQFNHHFRMLLKEDVNEEVLKFMKTAFDNAQK